MTRKATDLTSVFLKDLLPKVLHKIEQKVGEKGDLILAAWSSIVGEKFSLVTQAYAFKEGVVYVNVKNALVYSLLTQYEKKKLLSLLQEKFPQAKIRNIVFRRV